MKKSWITGFGILGLILICVVITPAMAVSSISVDGNLDEWGLHELVTDSWALNDTWLPNSDISYVVEDNVNPLYSNLYKGVHIKGTGSTYSFYDEPKTMNEIGEEVTEPYGGEGFDLEAIYITQDSTNLYTALITSVSPSEKGGLRPGDLALNPDYDKTTGDLGYEYGIVCGQYPYPSSAGLKQGDIVYLPKWEGHGATLPASRPDVIVGILPGGSIVGNLGTDLVYDQSWMTINDFNKPNYVLEMKIPKEKIGAANNKLTVSNIFYGDNCLNDTTHIYLASEFPTIAVSIGSILGLLFIVLVINGRKK